MQTKKIAKYAAERICKRKGKNTIFVITFGSGRDCAVQVRVGVDHGVSS